MHIEHDVNKELDFKRTKSDDSNDDDNNDDYFKQSAHTQATMSNKVSHMI